MGQEKPEPCTCVCIPAWLRTSRIHSVPDIPCWGMCGNGRNSLRLREWTGIGRPWPGPLTYILITDALKCRVSPCSFIWLHACYIHECFAVRNCQMEFIWFWHIILITLKYAWTCFILPGSKSYFRDISHPTTTTPLGTKLYTAPN